MFTSNTAEPRHYAEFFGGYHDGLVKEIFPDTEIEGPVNNGLAFTVALLKAITLVDKAPIDLNEENDKLSSVYVPDGSIRTEPGKIIYAYVFLPHSKYDVAPDDE